MKLARRIQAEIKSLVDGGTMTGSKGGRRPLRYGDMLVLVRRRGNAFDAVIQALKHAGIPVAGADRLKLTEHIAIIDLMNLADALLLPQDDLALAVALKSPLFGLTDDDLFKLAWQRKGSLRAALAARAATDGRLRDALWRLEQCERRFVSETPFTFYAWLLGGDGGRARILRRLGHEANDALDEFLELALNYERKAPASLQGFMAWLRAADTEVKRDMEISRDEVRVMTVHGAKGLEASVVFLVDTTTSPSDTQRLKLINLPQGNAGPHAPGVVVWAGRKAEDPPAVVAARAAMIGDTEDEYRRLLYVAMTRAADRLIVGGCLPGNMKNVRQVLLVRSDHQGPRQFRIAASGDPDRRRRGEALHAGRGSRARRWRRRDTRTDRAGRAAILAADTRAAGAIGRKPVAAIRPRRWRKPSGADGRVARCSAPAPCSAARWCTGCCNRCPISPPRAAARPRWPISPATPAAGPRKNSRRWRKARWP